jgi:hypothetical protein
MKLSIEFVQRVQLYKKVEKATENAYAFRNL